MSTDQKLDERYPEHAKLDRVKEQSQGIFDFLEWAEDKGYVFGQELPTEPLTVGEDSDSFDRYAASLGNIAQDSTFFRQAGETALHRLLAEHFDIDLKKLDAEKQQMLDDIRAMNATKGS